MNKIIVSFIFSFVLLLVGVDKVQANQEYTIDKNIIDISVQNKTILVDEEVYLGNVDTNTSGTTWNLINNSENKVKILSAFSNKKILIPHRLNKDGTVLIGDLNRKNSKNINFNIKYLINKNNPIVLNVDNTQNNKVIRLAINNKIKEVNCDNKSENIDLKTNNNVYLTCLNTIKITTEDVNNDFVTFINNWFIKIKNIFKF